MQYKKVDASKFIPVPESGEPVIYAQGQMGYPDKWYVKKDALPVSILQHMPASLFYSPEWIECRWSAQPDLAKKMLHIRFFVNWSSTGVSLSSDEKVEREYEHRHAHIIWEGDVALKDADIEQYPHLLNQNSCRIRIDGKVGEIAKDKANNPKEYDVYAGKGFGLMLNIEVRTLPQELLPSEVSPKSIPYKELYGFFQYVPKEDVFEANSIWMEKYQKFLAKVAK